MASHIYIKMVSNAGLNGVNICNVWERYDNAVWRKEEELGDSEVPRAHLSHEWQLLQTSTMCPPTQSENYTYRVLQPMSIVD